MDSLKNISKKSWKPGGSSSSAPSSSEKKSTITGLGVRSKLSDVKGRATGRDVDSLKHRDQALSHQSRPLTSLKDPASFAPPPKHVGAYGGGGGGVTGQGLIGNGSASGSSSTAVVRRNDNGATGGLGAPAVGSGYAERKAAEARERAEQEELERERRREVGYLKDTSGLRTDHLPPPPVRRTTQQEEESGMGVRRANPALPARNTQSPALPARTAQSPALPARTQSPALPPRRMGAAPPPVLPPRQNEYPDEHTPAPPPAYQEALKQPAVQQAVRNTYSQPPVGAMNSFATKHVGQAAGLNPSQQKHLENPAVQQAAKQTYSQNSGTINSFAAGRLSAAGVSVPGLGIGDHSSTTPSVQQQHQQQQPPPSTSTSTTQSHGPQLSELQSRFARMGTNTTPSSSSSTHSSPIHSSPIHSTPTPQQEVGSIASQKKAPPPPPPPKKKNVMGLLPTIPIGGGEGSSGTVAPPPPPLPLSSKPRMGPM